MKFRFDIGDIVNHSSYGPGIIMNRCLFARGSSGLRELYSVFFGLVLSNHGVLNVYGDELTLVER